MSAPLPLSTIGVDTLPFPPLIESFFALILLACFLLFALVFRHESIGLIVGLKNTVLFRNHKTAVFSEQVSPFKIRGNFYLILQTVLIISVFASFFFLKDNWQMLAFAENFLLFFGILLAVSLLFGLKYLLYKTIGTFFLRDEIGGWIARYFWIVKALGFLLFIPTVVYIYIGELRNFMFFVVVLLFFISRIFIFAEILNIFVKNKIGLLYFFVYFCGTEIAPYIVYFKGVFLLTTIVGNSII